MSLNVTMQHFRRLSISSQHNPHRFLRRMSNLQFPGGSFGYECSQHSSGDLEKGSLERSLGRGCKTLVTRTTDHTPEVYDFLFDLSDNEECDLQNMQIGHIYSTNRNISATTATACLKDVNAVLKQAKRGLDFVTVTVPSDEEVSLSALRNSLIEIRDSATVPTGKPVVRTGLDISTALLTMQNQPGALEKLTKEVLDPLCEEKLLQTLTIATNAFTFPQSHHLYRWVKNCNSESGNSSRKIQTIATEVLRAHPRTPALLTAGYPHTVPHRPSGRPATSPGQEEEAGDGAVDKRSIGVREATHNIQKAVADLELALDRCIQTEKIFLSKAGESVREKVPITDVCLGHVLYKTLAQFQSPEEWQSILSNQIAPKLERGLNVLQNYEDSSEMRDWVVIYHPVAKYLQASFRHLLQQRALLQSLEVQELLCMTPISSAFCPDLSAPTTLHLPGTLAQFTAAWCGADCVTLSHSQVESTRWTSELSVKNTPDLYSHDDVAALYSRIRDLLPAANQP